MTPEERFDYHVERRARVPSPGLAAVLSVFIPGLGHVYSGRLAAGLGWFLATTFGYWAILVPGFLIHIASIWFAYEAAKSFRDY
jgi:TM2 domain-containing membrane protein YozV